MSDIYILTKNRALMFLLFRLLIQDLKPHMEEHLRTLVGRHLPRVRGIC